MPPMPGRPGTLERWGVALLLVWVGWAATASVLGGRGFSPGSPYVAAPVALAAGVVLGAVLAPHGDTWAVSLALLATTAYFLVAVLVTNGPAKGPTGYANANAALGVQLTGLAGLALLGAHGPRRGLLAVSAVGGVVVGFADASLAAGALDLPLLALVLTMGWRPARRHTWRVVAAVLGVVAAVAMAAGVVALAARPTWPPWARRFLDEARHTMWSDALRLWQGHPLVGAGPGAFEQVSRLGHDPDTAAAHSSVLQVGAETGWVGVVIFTAIVLTGLLWASQGRTAHAILGIATWTALVVHSMADHLVDFPALVLTGGLVLGWSRASAWSEQLDVPEREGPG